VMILASNYALLADGLLLLKIIISNALTQDGKKQCVACNEFKQITLYEARTDVKCRQCANAWRKVKKHCDSCKCVVQWGSWRYHIKSKKHMRNLSS
jgi:hypothetical protein